MCGIIGFYQKNLVEAGPLPTSETRAILESMQARLSRRGPDEGGLANLGACWLGHTRLSIIDLSTGSQPVFNEDGRVGVVLNGEIYNYRDLRRSLERAGHTFRTHSDTEVIVHLYEEHGDGFLEYLNGMFAIVLYDARTDTLIAARDRLGEKPLLYCETAEALVIASEVKALLEHPAVDVDIDLEAIALYLNASYIPAPFSAFRAIRKLPAAHYLKRQGGKTSIAQYWRPKLASIPGGREEERCEQFVALFRDAVQMRMVADVPLGVFLSGGIDSSAVTAFMAEAAGVVNTFTVGFAEEIDERPFARQVAERYRTNHREIHLQFDAASVADEMFDYMDEPFGDSSIIPTFAVAREARRHVKVALTGDGGDELFAGYSAYLQQRAHHRSRSVSKGLYLAYSAFPASRATQFLDGLCSQRQSPRALSSWIATRTKFSDRQVHDLLGRPCQPSRFFGRQPWLPIADRDPLSVAFELDVNYYLPDDLLKKVDMASMRASLECRAPFLDHRIVEYAFTIPALMKVRNGSPKHLLKRALQPYLPSEILHREKTGFGAPVPSWIRGRMRAPVLDALRSGALIERFMSRSAIGNWVNRCFAANGAVEQSTPYRVWLLYALERWMQRYGASPAANRSVRRSAGEARACLGR